jgi:hypothetical protein
VLLTKTLRSSTFRVALFCILVFGALVIALFGCVYSSTASYVLDRSDRAIDGDRAALMDAYDRGGRAALVAAIDKIAADARFGDGAFLLADRSFAVLAGNLASWPPALAADNAGRSNFRAPEWKPDAAHWPLLRAAFATLPDGSHLLVGKDVSDLDQFGRKIDLAFALVIALIFVLAAVAGIAVTPAYRRPHRVDQRHQPRDHAERARRARALVRHRGRMGPAGGESQLDARPHRDLDG